MGYTQETGGRSGVGGGDDGADAAGADGADADAVFVLGGWLDDVDADLVADLDAGLDAGVGGVLVPGLTANGMAVTVWPKA